MGEGSDVCEGAGGEEAGESCGRTKEKDGEGESVRKQQKMKNGRERLFSELRGHNSYALSRSENYLRCMTTMRVDLRLCKPLVTIHQIKGLACVKLAPCGRTIRLA
jgi:hypothetical protein